MNCLNESTVKRSRFRKDVMVDIGLVAGVVWRLLKRQGKMVRVSDLCYLVRQMEDPGCEGDFSRISPVTVDFAVGWLARENKLVFGNKGKAITVGILP